MTKPSATASRRAVFTGMGLVNAAGEDTESVWQTIQAGKSAIGPARRFDATGLDVCLVAEIPDFHPAKQISRRIIAKSDRFAHFALTATSQALDDAGLDLDGLDPFRIGISFGNNSGGWDICERGFLEYYREGPSMVNPWQATAWFPTAPQGFVSIQFNVRGWSKSFACDRASGACAARVYGELLAVEQRTGPPDDPRDLEDTLRAALAQAGRHPAQVGLVFGEGCGSVSGDQLEADVLNRVLPGVPVTVPKAAIGHLYGASTGTDIALALLAVRDRVIPATAHAESDPA